MRPCARAYARVTGARALMRVRVSGVRTRLRACACVINAPQRVLRACVRVGVCVWASGVLSGLAVWWCGLVGAVRGWRCVFSRCKPLIFGALRFFSESLIFSGVCFVFWCCRRGGQKSSENRKTLRRHV